MGNIDTEVVSTSHTSEAEWRIDDYPSSDPLASVSAMDCVESVGTMECSMSQGPAISSDDSIPPLVTHLSKLHAEKDAILRRKGNGESHSDLDRRLELLLKEIAEADSTLQAQTHHDVMAGGKNMEQKSDPLPPAQPAVVVHDNPFLQRALRDLEACTTELTAFHFYQERCDTMVNLFRGAIQVAQQSGDSGRLKKTYYNIQKMLSGWYFEGTFKSIFRNTLHDLEAGIIPMPASLFTENQRLEANLAAAEEARDLFQAALEEKEATLSALQAENVLVKGERDRLKTENAHLTSDLASERAENARLRAELERGKRKNKAKEAPPLLSRSSPFVQGPVMRECKGETANRCAAGKAHLPLHAVPLEPVGMSSSFSHSEGKHN